MSGNDTRKTYSGHQFGKLLGDIAREKDRKTQSRLRRRPAGLEDPRAVFIDVCSRVCASYADRGFKFAKSGPHMTRRDADISCEVRFQSSPNNIAGEYVLLIGHASVRSGRLKKWQRDNNGVWKNGHIAGGQLGALQEHQHFIEWNLADPAARNGATLDIIAHIERFALPLFDRCRDLPSIFRDVSEGRDSVVGFDPVMTIEMMLAFGYRELAMAAGLRIFGRFSAEEKAQFAENMLTYEVKPANRLTDGNWVVRTLAKVAFFHKLDFAGNHHTS